MTIDLLLSHVDEILSRISLSQLSRYDRLQRSLYTTNVAADPVHQRLFNGYYRMQRRAPDWYEYFFLLLEREKTNTNITFREVLEQTFSVKWRVEPSFCSKLVATIRPELPVYDKYVRENLVLTVPQQHKAAQIRVREFIAAYSSLESQVVDLVQSPRFIEELHPAFDKTFRSYSHLTDVKKLDLLLWQYRSNAEKSLSNGLP